MSAPVKFGDVVAGLVLPPPAAARHERRPPPPMTRDGSWCDGQLRKIAPVVGVDHALSPEQTEAIKAVDSWLAGGCSRHLVLFGGVGCGKTVAALYAARRWLEKFKRVAWLTPDQLVSAVLHAYDENSPRLENLVVVDDMGRERKAEFSDALCDLFDRDGHKIVITSNLTTPQFRERYTDKRLLDRFGHLCTAVRLSGASKRAGNGGF